MARKLRSKIATRSARLALPISETPVWETVSRTAAGTVRVGYRRNKGTGSYVGGISNGKGGYKTWTLEGVVPDDFENADGVNVYNFEQAADLIRKLARGENGSGSGEKPATVADAIDGYRSSLRARGAEERNANRIRDRLPAGLLARPITLLAANELCRWRDGLLDDGLSRGAVTRLCAALKAALSYAAKRDSRIVARPWTDALERLPGAWKPVDKTLSDDAVKRIVAAAYGLSAEYGRLVNVLATLGVRLSQAIRITVGDQQADLSNPRVMVPTSKKGRRREAGLTPVPIPVALATELSMAAAGRDPTAPLLACNGAAWATHVAVKLFAKATAAAVVEATSSNLRHSAICRMLIRGTPIRLVASLHDTSTAMIERTYAKHIAEYSDDVVRAGLLDCSVPTDEKVVALRR